MTQVKMPPGFPSNISVHHPVGEDKVAGMEEFMAARHKAILEICREKGWILNDEEFDSSKLTMAQLLEVRSDTRWMDPLGQEK